MTNDTRVYNVIVILLICFVFFFLSLSSSKGFGETAQTLVRVASKEHEVKGTVGAVGGVLRQIPSTALTPIIIASQATSNVLDGVKSQLIPDSRNEAALKWRKDYF